MQVDLAPEVRVVGEHCSEDKPGCQFVTATVPEVAAIVSAAPSAKDATGLLIATGTVAPLVAGERVTVTVAITPPPIAESFIPAVRQVTEPLAELQVRVLFALVSVAAAATERELTSLGANVNVHCKPAGAPLLLLNERFNETDPPSTADPDERLRAVV
ncbi:MAG: hypothetical protein WAJ87_06770 [Bryobacteraceae bacterium]